MKRLTAIPLTGLLLVTLILSADAANWPGWRDDGRGISQEKNLPLKWSPNENVRWHVDLPDRGNSSPIVWGDRVFVTQATSEDDRRTVMCFDRANGKLLWRSGVTYSEQEPTHRENPYCAATPVTDGERVIASFGSAGLYCYDFAGKELWHREFGKMNHMFGNAASPMLAGDLCVLNFGPDEKARLIAVDKRSGETVWEVKPPEVDPSEQQQPMRGGFAGGGGPGGPSGPGGRNIGPGSIVATQLLLQADRNSDRKLSGEEFAGLADAWFDKLDTEKSGKLSEKVFTEKISEVLPPPQEFRRPEGGDRGGRRGGFDPSRFVGPGIFAAADMNKDGSLTRDELKTTFAKWFEEWDSTKSGPISEEQLGAGLNATLMRPRAGGFGGGGGGRGPGGFGGGGGPGGSWSTPILIKAGDREELIMSFPNRLVAYEPKSGKQLWMSKGLGGTIYTTPVWGDGTLVGMTSGPGGGSAIAVKPGGNGDVTESQRLWRLERAKSGIGSGVIREGYVYNISQDGIATCLDLKTGNTVWEERLKGSGSRGSSWSSMLLADGKIYVPNQSGDVFVLRASPKFELLATNSVGEATNASLAASDGELFLRTEKALWCFGEKK